MKTTTNKLNVLLIAGVLAVSSCSDSQTQKAEEIANTVEEKVDTAISNVKEGAEAVADNVKDALTMSDSDFVVKAANDNALETTILQAGLNKGTDKDLKGHARMMMADHKKLGGKVKAYAGKRGYVLQEPDKNKADDEIAELDKNTKGLDWDKAWTNKMVAAHDDAVRMFEKGEKNAKDQELKTMITETLPTLRDHLEMMKNLKEKLRR